MRFTVALTLCAVVWTSGCCCRPDGNKKEGSEVSASKAVEPSKPVADKPEDDGTIEFHEAVNAQDLYEAYEANEVSADDRYKGKVLLTSGKIDSIDKDFMGDIVLKLRTGNRFAQVHATLRSSEKAKAAAMAKGSAVRLVCVGGTRVINSPTLRKCRVLDKDAKGRKIEG